MSQAGSVVMSAVDVVGSGTVRSSSTLVVGVKRVGIVLPRLGEEDEVVLDLAGLELIQRLVSGRHTLAELRASADGVGHVLDVLEARGLVLPTPSPVASDAPTSWSDAPSAPLGDDFLVLPTPILLGCAADGFEFVDHDGVVQVRLAPAELCAAGAFRAPMTHEGARAAQQQALGTAALTDDRFADLVGRLQAASLLIPLDDDDPSHARLTRQTDTMRDAMRRQARVHAEFDRLEEEHDAAGGPAGRVPIVAVHSSWSAPPASLGMVLAFAKEYDGGVLREAYDFRPRLTYDDQRLRDVAASGTGIFLFSNYIWSSEVNLGHSAAVKDVSPTSVTIHGGPDTPKYLGDVEQYFADHPHVDIAVHTEGEATFADLLMALRGSIGEGPPDLSVLGDVPGLSFRDGDRVVQTAARDRIADVDQIPSPLLTGLYDGFIPAGPVAALVLETNRGCPYGCTFCDWGSATLSRIRKFDLDRVFAELDWCGVNQMETVGIADANFGIFERDVQIAQRIADLKAEYGYPRMIGTNYAKNTVKHLSKIIEIFTEAGIVAEGKMSMQTFDTGTLATIRRKNIKVQKYIDLSVEFSRNRLPLSVDLMMGLPGSRPDTFRNDLQQCVDRNVRAVIHATTLLPNSPMNEPAYREENGIVAKPGELVKETTTFTVDEWEQMYRLTMSYYLLENFGVLRQIAMYVHGEKGTREVDFYEKFTEDVHAEPERWPASVVTLRTVPYVMVPPVTWRWFYDEVRRYLVEIVGLEDDSALDTVMTVQHALMPDRNRVFPVEVDLQHDFVTWRREVFRVREDGNWRNWHDDVPALRSLGPGSLPLADTFEVCATTLGGSLQSLSIESSWDLDSPVSRPRQRMAESPDDVLVEA